MVTKEVLKRRYMLFAFDAFYPSGGMDDLIGKYVSKEDAINKIDKLKDEYQYYEVYDFIKDEIVYEKEMPL